MQNVDFLYEKSFEICMTSLYNWFILHELDSGNCKRLQSSSLPEKACCATVCDHDPISFLEKKHIKCDGGYVSNGCVNEQVTLTCVLETSTYKG